MNDLRKAAEMAACEVPLHELLEGVPENARLVIDSEDGRSTRYIPVGQYCKRAAEALRQALAQPEQEPEAWTSVEDPTYLSFGKPNWVTPIPLYTAPPKREWVWLTDEEMNELWVKYHGDNCIADGRIPEYEKAIEAKLKEKNT